MKRVLIATTMALASFFSAASGAAIPWQYGSHHGSALPTLSPYPLFPSWYQAQPKAPKSVHAVHTPRRGSACLMSWDDKLIAC